MGIAVDLRRQLRREAGVALPQFDAGLPCEIHPLRPRAPVEPETIGCAIFFFHHGRVDGHPLQLQFSTGSEFRPVSMVLVSSHSTPSSPIRLRQRVSEVGSIGGRC